MIPQMIPQFNIVKPDSLIADLRATVNKMIAMQKTKDQHQRENELITDISQTKLEETLTQEVKILKIELARKTTQVEELNKRLDEQEHQLGVNYKREFRHLSDTLVQKEAQIQYLNKQVQKHKNRITSLEQELLQANSTKESLEESLMKTIELIKSQFKEIFDTNQDMDLNQFMSEASAKQINDKLDALLNICVDLEKKKKFMEDKYTILKKEHSDQIDNNIKLQVELQKVREQLWQEKRIVESFNNNKKFAAEEVAYFSKKSKASRFSAEPFEIVSQENKGSETAYYDKLDETISLLKAETRMLLKFEEKLVHMNKKIDQQTNIWKEVMTVKELNTGLQRELNQLKGQINPAHQDELLKSKHPNLYEFFSSKMKQIQKFQQRLQTVEKDAHRATSMLERILYEGVPQKKLELNEAQIFQRERVIKSKVKKEMLESFESEKQKIIKDAENHYQQEITELKAQIVDLKSQVSRLKDKNENLYNLLEEFEKENKAKSQLEIKPEKMEICNPGPNDGPKEKFDTQSMIEVRPSQSQLNQIHFLEEKAERLEYELKECKQKIEVYKKEIRYILETYKPKNTKIKLIRCNECFIRINEKDDDSFKCEKCRLDIHDGDCAKFHEKNCKKNNVVNKVKPKKSELKPPPMGLSQNLDYF